ncbi:hypothetical protein CERZMDRAFT_97027 [Cercospora zeae-maydis SCOH1-5]|uniref:Uncharacterized protein n=1 Tax=Cercospora zeae-maydis SCOH1-5 TaxID=717836 RepID=A0A6A6FGD9_9PEZI|nr:hypothetical protein CERZMDRAFT_97027 [Cercospora zeae-maydis SCOH1-5]
MKFTVHIMPPPRQRPPDSDDTPPPARTASTPPATAHVSPPVALEKFAIPIDPTSNFAAVWKEAEQRYRRLDKDGMARMYFSHMRDLDGGKIAMTDTIMSMYEKDTPASERQLFMYMDHSDRRSGTVPGSSQLPPQRHHKRPRADMNHPRQAPPKRHRVEEARLGATAGQLNAAGTASSSRGAGDEDAVEAGAKVVTHIPESPRTEIANTGRSSGIVEQERAGATQQTTPDPTQVSPLSSRSPVRDTSAKRTPKKNAFNLLGRQRHSSRKGSTKINWRPAEDKILKQGLLKNWKSKRISEALAAYGRSEGAVRARKQTILRQEPSLLRRSAQKRESTPRLGSSPPLATASSDLPSSPCTVAAVSATIVGPSVIAYVRLPDAPPRDGPPLAAQTVPVGEQVSGQTATPPTSNPSEVSVGKLRAPALRSTNASRLRKSRNHARLVRAGGKPGAAAVNANVNDTNSITYGAAEQVSVPIAPRRRPLESLASAGKSTAQAEATRSSLARDIETQDDDMHEVRAERAETSANDIPASQVKAEVTVPARKQGGAMQRRKDKARWREALSLAKGRRAEAEHIFMMNLNREAMLEAVTVEDNAEIERLKAQRRRLERELAVAKGVPPPKRRVPSTFARAIGHRSRPDDADEEVVREDGWSTDDGERGREMLEDFEDSDGYNESASASDDDNEFEDVDVDINVQGPRVIELTPTPPPSIVAVEGDDRPISKETNRNKRCTQGAESKHDPMKAPKFHDRKVSPADARATAARSKSKHRRTSRKVSIAASDVVSRGSASSERPKKPLGITTQRKLTRDQVVAAHLEECKRKEALWLNDDSDDDSNASSP